MLFNFALECFIRNVQGIQEVFNRTHQLLVYVGDLCGESVNVVKNKFWEELIAYFP
jgi:hypothetical protein